MRRRTRSIGRAAPRVRHASPAALVYLRGRDADGRLRELAEQRAGARPLLGDLALTLLDRKGYEKLGFRSLADWSRERIGVGARTVREWARVARALSELPGLRRAVLAGEVSWTVARKVVGHATPENEQAVLATVRGRSVRAVEALLAEAFPGRQGATSDDERVAVSVRCSPEVSTTWVVALDENECSHARGLRGKSSAPRAAGESGFHALVWPHLPWRRGAAEGTSLLGSLGLELEMCSPRQLDRRFRRAIAFLQKVDFELGRVLRQVVERKLYHELGFESFERYVVERLDLSPRTARRLVRMARAERRAPAVASAFRDGRITLLQAEVLLRGNGAEADVELAERAMLRRLEDELPQRKVVGVHGRAPDALTYELGVGTYRSGDVRAG